MPDVQLHNVQPGYNKVAVGGGLGVLATPVILYIATALGAPPMPPEAAAALSGLITAIGVYLTRERYTKEV